VTKVGLERILLLNVIWRIWDGEREREREKGKAKLKTLMGLRVAEKWHWVHGGSTLMVRRVLSLSHTQKGKGLADLLVPMHPV